MSEELASFLVPDEPLPFEHLFSPLVLNARVALRWRTDSVVYGLLRPEAHTGWERYLLTRLTACGAKAAHWQFEVFKTVRSVFPKARNATGVATDSLYREFVGKKIPVQLQKLFDEFPALAQLCSILVENWLSTVAEFLVRLNKDREELSERFMAGRSICTVSALQTGLSDPHRGGRCVVRMHFENGARLIYKPRSLAPEAHFATLLRRVNTAGIKYPLRAAQCWDRNDYGWMENIEQGQCNNSTGVHAFYWRAGALLGSTHLARGVDFHRENLIAAGEFPVLIDLEGLWHPQEPTPEGLAPIVNSVLNTGFLPQKNPRSGKTYERGALSRQTHSARSTVTWTHINRDDMVLKSERREFQHQSHLPVFAGQAYVASDYVPDIQAGFQWIGEHLLGDDGEREKTQQWLHTLMRCPRRFIPRPTAHYQAMLEQLTTPQSLRNQRLNASSVTIPRQAGGPIIEKENLALEEFDVPYFEQSNQEGIDSGDNIAWDHSDENYSAQILVIAESLGCNAKLSQP